MIAMSRSGRGLARACRVMLCGRACQAHYALDRHVILAGSQPNELGCDSLVHNLEILYFLYNFGLPKQSRTFPPPILKFWD